MAFLSTPSGWRATKPTLATITPSEISIHALRVEGDKRRRPTGRPAGISIHALRVEGDGLQVLHDVHLAVISIHALRVEGDRDKNPEAEGRVISIHALRVEGDRPIFQSL